MDLKWKLKVFVLLGGFAVLPGTAMGQLVDKTNAPNTANQG
ncbi:MAG: hypothetical protein ACREDR_40180 [Blastocatellia bacterium]